MNIRLLFSAVLFISFVGCAKQENEPSTPVLNFYKYVTAGDSIGVINSFASTIRDQLTSDDTAHSMRHLLNGWSGRHAEVIIHQTKIDSGFSDMAKVYFKLTITGKNPSVRDSFYLITMKEEGQWKISSPYPNKDK